MQLKPIKDHSPFVLFLPLLFIYIVYVCYFHTDQMDGDEMRYMQFAENLLQGFYSPAYPHIDLINGPGYPIILMPFVALKLPLIFITLLNAVLYYLSVVFLFKSTHLLTVSFKKSCIVTLLWGGNILAYQEMPCILTECLTAFLLSAFSYQIIKIYSVSAVTYKTLLAAGFTFGFLILTKVIFGYVLLMLLVSAGLCYVIHKQSEQLLKIVCILCFSALTITPYIVYTYSLTGKFFYLSSEGGKVLYWMTSLDAHEYGDWNNNTFTSNCSETFCNADYIAKNHAADIEQINQCKSVLEADVLFKKMALENIKSNPVKYIKNWFANIGRLLFGFPASYYFQSPATLVRIYINSALLLALVYSCIAALLNWKKLPMEIKILIGFSILYLGLSSLVSAFPRQFNVIVPILLIWITYVIKRTVKIDLKINSTY